MSALGGMVRKGRFVMPVLLAVAIAGATSSSNDEVPPQTLRMGDKSFKVELEPFPNLYAGMTYFDKQLIRIDPSSTALLRRRVYFHELMHVAWHQGKPSANKQRTYTEDEAIEELVPGLLKLLKENPEAVEYLRNTRGATIAQGQVPTQAP